MSHSIALKAEGLLNTVDRAESKTAFEMLKVLDTFLTALAVSEGEGFTDWLFDLSRELFVASKPRSTRALLKAIEIELVFMGAEEMYHRAQNRNSEKIEELFWIEIVRRAELGTISFASFWLIVTNFHSEDLRREFLFWFSGWMNQFDLVSMLNLRNHLALGLSKESPSNAAELEIVDEVIKLRLATSSDEELRQMYAYIAVHPMPLLPSYLLPIRQKLFWYSP